MDDNRTDAVTAPTPDSPRVRREMRTFRAMLRIYCKAHHRPGADLCADCRGVMDYAICRLQRCPFGTAKPACSDCPIHCYRPAMKTIVRQIMRFAGPRMMLRHPFLAILHQWDRFGRRRTG